MGIIVSYESIWRGLQVNAAAVMKEIVEKTRFNRFFISYNNMDFYKNVRDQQLHNRSAIVNYTAGYICFMKPPEGGREDCNVVTRDRLTGPRSSRPDAE